MKLHNLTLQYICFIVCCSGLMLENVKIHNLTLQNRLIEPLLFSVRVVTNICWLRTREPREQIYRLEDRLDLGSIRSSPRYSLSSPYRLTIRNSARLFHLHHVLFNMVNLHLFLPALNFSTLNAGILIMMQHLCPH